MSILLLDVHCPKCGSGQVEVYADAKTICICLDCQYGDEMNEFDCSLLSEVEE